MPCIVKCKSRKGFEWEALCGRGIPRKRLCFMTVDEAKEKFEHEGMSICPVCKKAAGISWLKREKVPEEIFIPKIIYVVAGGEIKEFLAIEKTKKCFKDEGGNLLKIGERIREISFGDTPLSHLDLPLNAVTTDCRETAISTAKEQLGKLDLLAKSLMNTLTKSKLDLTNFEADGLCQS